MTAPIAAMSVVSWLKNPYQKGKNEVKIRRLDAKDIIICALMTVSVTVIFFFVLRALNTPNLLVSTVSITTSFLASYLMFMRNSYYAVAYAANDVVLVVLWVFATVEDIVYLPMVACFGIFLVNDIYGFLSWKKREKKQGLNK